MEGKEEVLGARGQWGEVNLEIRLRLGQQSSKDLRFGNGVCKCVNGSSGSAGKGTGQERFFHLFVMWDL